jgi:hypothetical protein
LREHLETCGTTLDLRPSTAGERRDEEDRVGTGELWGIALKNPNSQLIGGQDRAAMGKPVVTSLSQTPATDGKRSSTTAEAPSIRHARETPPDLSGNALRRKAAQKID